MLRCASPYPSQLIQCQVCAEDSFHFVHLANAPSTINGSHDTAKLPADSLLRAKGKPLLRIPLRNGGLTFEFEAEADRDQAVDVLTPLLKEAQRKGKGIASVAAGPPSPAGAVSGPQAALKLQLLKENRCIGAPTQTMMPHACGRPASQQCGHVMRRDLQQLYNQLVMRGVLTEEEFWRGRQSLLKHKLQDGAAQKQRRGFDNAMISEVAAGGGSKVMEIAFSCHQLLGQHK